MEVAKNLVVFKEIWKDSYVAGGDKLDKMGDGYYAMYMVNTLVEPKGDVMYCFQTNPEMIRAAEQNSRMKAVKRFENEIIRRFEKRFYGDDIPRYLSYENRIYAENGVCAYNEKERNMWICTPVFVKYYNTNCEAIKNLKKEGKIVE